MNIRHKFKNHIVNFKFLRSEHEQKIRFLYGTSNEAFNGILAEEAIVLSVTLCGDALIANWNKYPIIVQLIRQLAIFIARKGTYWGVSLRINYLKFLHRVQKRSPLPLTWLAPGEDHDSRPCGVEQLIALGVCNSPELL